MEAATGRATSHPPGALQTLGRRLAGHSSIYVFGAVLSSMYGLAQIAVLTRVLPVDGIGRLAILLFFSSLITHLCNLGFVTGTMLALPFSGRGGGGAGGDVDDGGDEEELEDKPPRPPAGDPRKLLGTGMSIALLLTAGLTVLSIPLADPLSNLLLGDTRDSAAIVWATAVGGLATVWRMVTSVPRFERRPARYVALQAGYWAVSLGAAAALASAGYGVAGAMAGIALGHAAAGAVGLWLARHRYRLALQREAVAHLGKRGLPYVSITLPGFATRHADLYVLSLYVPNRDLALYTVATRLSRIPSLAAGGAMYAFGPLSRGPMRAALDRDHSADFARERIVSYYMMLAAWNVVALAIWVDVIVKIVPESYANAALLIQLFALVAAFSGAQGLIYRMSRFPEKIKQLRRIVIVTAVLTVGSALVLTPPYGVYGAVASAAFGPAFGIPVLLTLGRRGPTPLPLSAARFARLVGIAIACVALGSAARALPNELELVAKVALTLVFPVLLVVANVMPGAEVKRLAGFVQGLWAPRSERARLVDALTTLEQADLALLEALAIRREDPDVLAERLGQTGDDVRRRFVGVLRSLGVAGAPSPADDRIADFLLSTAHRTERDGMGLLLSIRGKVDPLELDRLDTLLARLRRLSPDTWRRSGPRRELSRSAADRPKAPQHRTARRGRGRRPARPGA